MEGAALSGIEGEASGSPSGSRTAQGGRGDNILLRCIRRAVNVVLGFFRGFGGSEPEDPIPSNEPVLVSIRKKGSTGGSPDESNVRGREEEAETGAPSDVSEESNEESDVEEEKQQGGESGSMSHEEE
ncbi:hypothetical protein Emed_003669 [Eimeria media]